ncbi:PepSY domain-containing protein [Altererythrobacter sp.]|uniref:PepSY domain-containing protein n=1 Tax=Altererythrobacter sp. TaxID=1872480 RepID=UPI003CFF3C7C
MAEKPLMLRLAKWHIWLGWLVGFPILMWMASGLFMAARPIEEVRGGHMRLPVEAQPLILPGSALASEEFPLKEMRAVMQGGRAIAILTGMDGSVRRVDMDSGTPLPALSASDARRIVGERIVGGDKITSVRQFEADKVPFDFRRPVPVWQVVLGDGTHVYVGRDTGEIEAVRTGWWRAYDFMWGLHIMDLQTREETSHPILIIFAALGLTGALFGCILMFRRRTARRMPGSRS